MGLCVHATANVCILVLDHISASPVTSVLRLYWSISQVFSVIERWFVDMNT